ncbi:MAG: hypothetical protein WA421_06600 [Nitrososphaeraceae archaeon]
MRNQTTLLEFKKLGSIEKKRYREAVKDLGLSDDPKKIRQYEDTGCYAYNLTKSCRLIYRVSNKEKVNNWSLLVTTKSLWKGLVNTHQPKVDRVIITTNQP